MTSSPCVDTNPNLPLPEGFSSAGTSGRVRLGLVMTAPARAAGLLTLNRAAAPCVRRTSSLIAGGSEISAILVSAGNANVLNGTEGVSHDRRLAEAAASALGRPTDSVLTACTGRIGQKLALRPILERLPSLPNSLSVEPTAFLEAIGPGDKLLKSVRVSVELEEGPRTIHILGKGSRRVAPELATLLVFVLTDASLSRTALDMLLRAAAESSIQQTHTDGHASTNDMVLALANGTHEPIEATDPDARTFLKGLTVALQTFARLVTRDAARNKPTLQVDVVGAPSFEEARALALGLVSSPDVRSSFRRPEYGAAVVSALGSVAGMTDTDLDPAMIRVAIGDQELFSAGQTIPWKYAGQTDALNVVVSVGVTRTRGSAFGSCF